ncbi:MAG: MBL fold metallo-hydrolase [Crocinitomicaceae bacterium]
MIIKPPFKYLGITLLLFSIMACARRLDSVFDKHDNVKRTEIPSTVFKHKDYGFNFKDYDKSPIAITYLGCGGFSIKRNDNTVLIDPFFTNPGPLKGAGVCKMKTKTEKVSIGMANIPNFVNENVAAILVSHSHYDHLMDVPYVYDRYTNPGETEIYCSQSSKNMINGVGKIEAEKITTLNYETSSVNQIGDRFFLAEGSIRITPILSEHAPHYKSIKMFEGDAKPKHKYTEPLDRSRAGWWKEGETYAFLIDFLSPTNSDSIEFRIFLQSSAANPQNGWLHPDLKVEHPVNLALLGIASFDYVDHYPESLIDHLEPEKLVLCHWEDFFKKYDRKKPKRVRATKVREAIRRVALVYPHSNNKEEQFILPYPGVTINCSK